MKARERRMYMCMHMAVCSRAVPHLEYVDEAGLLDVVRLQQVPHDARLVDGLLSALPDVCEGRACSRATQNDCKGQKRIKLRMPRSSGPKPISVASAVWWKTHQSLLGVDWCTKGMISPSWALIRMAARGLQFALRVQSIGVAASNALERVIERGCRRLVGREDIAHSGHIVHGHARADLCTRTDGSYVERMKRT